MKVFFFNSGGNWVNCPNNWKKFINDVHVEYSKLSANQLTDRNLKFDNFLDHQFKLYGITVDSHKGVWFDSAEEKTAFMLRWNWTES